ncbi:MAG: DUF6671 family protein [Silanimonas sp.]
MRLDYRGHRVAVATLHGKAEALAPALSAMGLQAEAVAIDTDALGTFAGDIERPGTAREVVIEKARRGMAAAGLPLGLATEGSFGPDPLLGFLPLHVERLAFVDDMHGQLIVLEHAGHETNWRTRAVCPGEALPSLLAEIGLPAHAALVKPNAWLRDVGHLEASAPAMPVAKGLRDAAEVSAAVERIAAESADGFARVEADLRAHMNPTRMRVIAALGERLRDRLSTPCPACGVPGFGRIDAEPGLPCELCGAPTDLVRAEIHGCGACAYRVARPRVDGRRSADAGHCPECNP